MDIQDYVCEAPQTSRLSGVAACINEIDTPAPIDFFRENSREIIAYGTPERLQEMDKLGGFLLLGLVSSAEGYFRSIFSAALDICPVSKRFAAEKQINLGGVLWHGKDEFRRSAFEHMSFASAKELMTASRGYISFEMKGSVFDSILEDFDVICNLRHGLIHNAGILPGRNAVQIDIQRYSKSVEILIDYAFLQSAAATLDSLVATYNRALFLQMCERWADSWRNRADWIPGEERKRFMQIWNVFSNKLDLGSRVGRTKITPSECMAKIRATYNI
ncbi:hypothetical protein ACPA1H_14525 [Ectopseudomonas chengduensis]